MECKKNTVDISTLTANNTKNEIERRFLIVEYKYYNLMGFTKTAS